MKITTHHLSRNAVAFEFNDGHTLTITGGRQHAHYTHLEFLREVSLEEKSTKVGVYRPEDNNPKLKLATGYDRERFLSYWKAASVYFEEKMGAMSNSNSATSAYDLNFLFGSCKRSVVSAQDGRRTKAGSL